MTEDDTRANYIDPKLNALGWSDLQSGARIYRQRYFTNGRIMAGGKHGERGYTDYLLTFNNKKIGIIEAKKAQDHPTKGLQQAKDYATMLNVRFVYSTNGKEIYEFDMHTGRGDYVGNFPSPKTLFDRVITQPDPVLNKLLAVPFNRQAGYDPYYFQENAANAVLEAITEGKQRILLTMATGTGKTFTAFQIVWKLYQARWNRRGDDRRLRVLYLADRNILIGSQTMRDFNPMEEHCIRIDGAEIRRRGGNIPTNANVFFAIYQGIIGDIKNPYYKDYPKDFFDLVIVDECHRGSAKDESQWREVLNHFSGAVHLGMTATPKRKDNVDTYAYFGNPVYTYSLKEGINDGFLTPFKVKRISTTIDDYQYTEDDEVLAGEVEKELYEKKDFNVSIEIREREEHLVKILLNEINPKQKTIVFCANQEHAALIRDLIDRHKSSDEPNYVVRVTSDEGEIGNKYLRAFQDNEKTIPTILTTSQKLSTGVDARNVRFIVLLRHVGSMIEFKQIIGRGTRIFDGKEYFTIVDFYDNVEHFADPEWDGEPEAEIDIKDPRVTDDRDWPDRVKDSQGENNDWQPPDDGGVIVDPVPDFKEKLRVKLSDGKVREIKHMVQTLYFDEHGKPMTAQQFLEKLFGALPHFFDSEERLRDIWSNPETRKRLLAELARSGFDADKLKSLQELVDAQDSDMFDVLRYVAFAKDTLTRQYRAENVGAGFYSELSEEEESFVRFILVKYEENGVDELSEENLENLVKLLYGSSYDAVEKLGNTDKIRSDFLGLQKELYEVEK